MAASLMIDCGNQMIQGRVQQQPRMRRGLDPLFVQVAFRIPRATQHNIPEHGVHEKSAIIAIVLTYIRSPASVPHTRPLPLKLFLGPSLLLPVFTLGLSLCCFVFWKLGWPRNRKTMEASRRLGCGINIILSPAARPHPYPPANTDSAARNPQLTIPTTPQMCP
ncbi:hypothetical protein CPB86DRAFT_317116 [Serendipita vermifera]|nr:hypothetical protein CPB86DRAFT_317116 [Serendipita vermifera]